MCLPSFLVTHVFQLHILRKERSQIVQGQEADWKARASANLSNQLVTLTENIQRYKYVQTLCLNKALENTQQSFQKINSIIGLWHVNASSRSICSDWSVAINHISSRMKFGVKYLLKQNSLPRFLEDSECRQTNLKTSHVKLESLQLSVVLFFFKYWFFSKSVISIFVLWQWKMLWPKGWL